MSVTEYMDIKGRVTSVDGGKARVKFDSSDGIVGVEIDDTVFELTGEFSFSSLPLKERIKFAQGVSGNLQAVFGRGCSAAVGAEIVGKIDPADISSISPDFEGGSINLQQLFQWLRDMSVESSEGGSRGRPLALPHLNVIEPHIIGG